MPFKSAKQELAMERNAPKVHAEWVKRYGHHPKYRALKKAQKRKNRRNKMELI